MVSFLDLKREINSIGEVGVLNKYLTDAERHKFACFKYEKRKVEWLAGRVAVKNAVIDLCGNSKENWKMWQVVAKKSGRPYIKSDKSCPEISISHSGGYAVAMAAMNISCGIDIQEVTEKVVKVKDKFVDDEESDLCKITNNINRLSEEKFLTLLWSAKESLRKGVELIPVPGFLELKLCGISGELSKGFVFDFIFQRDLKNSKNSELLKTFQKIEGKYAISIFCSNCRNGIS